MRRSFDTFSSVRMKGLEPIRRKTLDPKSSAATNYATSANGVANIHRFRKYAKRKPFVFLQFYSSALRVAAQVCVCVEV